MHEVASNRDPLAQVGGVVHEGVDEGEDLQEQRHDHRWRCLPSASASASAGANAGAGAGAGAVGDIAITTIFVLLVNIARSRFPKEAQRMSFRL